MKQSITNPIIKGSTVAVIIDTHDEKVTLAVNWPGGLYSLYYFSDGNSLFFATRFDLLFHECGLRPMPNQQSIVDLFRFGGLATDNTMFEGIRRVVPGFAIHRNWPRYRVLLFRV